MLTGTDDDISHLVVTCGVGHTGPSLRTSVEMVDRTQARVSPADNVVTQCHLRHPHPHSLPLDRH